MEGWNEKMYRRPGTSGTHAYVGGCGSDRVRFSAGSKKTQALMLSDCFHSTDTPAVYCLCCCAADYTHT